jgi:protein required for attachment to host cells
MDLKGRLQGLATLESQYPHVLSVYLLCRDGAHDRRKENLIFLKNRASEIERVMTGDKRGLDFLRDGVKAVELIRKQDLNSNVIGLALFLQGGKVVERFETSIPFEDQMAYRRYPFISQLAFIGEEFEPYAVVHLDSRTARIFEIALGELVDSSDIKSEVHRRIHRGGWSQMRFQRGIEGEKHVHIKEVADALTGLVSKHRYKRIVVIGPDKSRSILRQSVTADVARRIIDGEAVDSRAADHELLQTAVDYFRGAETVEENQKIEHVIREIHSSTMGVSGLDDTLTYLSRGQAYEVLLPSDMKLQGSQCNECGMIFKEHASTCHACDSKDISNADLKECVTRTAVKFGTKLEFIKNNNFQSRLGGAAALLRSPRMS